MTRRIANRLAHDRGRRQVNRGIESGVAADPCHAAHIAHVATQEGHTVRHRAMMPLRQIVDDNNPLSAGRP